MRYTNNWKDYQLIDASCGERLERWGDMILVRPDPQVIWDTPRIDPRWQNPHARYFRSSSGGGNWEIHRKIPEKWQISFKNLKFNLKIMNFKHTGIFPEQAVNWEFMQKTLKEKKNLKILNLFAYTGAASLACAAEGAEVCHVDASKGITQQARENAETSGLSGAKIRWIVDDCEKFLQREKKRGKKYDAIVMDPPSYGRGPKGEIWKIEEDLYNFLNICKEVLSESASFFLLNSYSTGLSASIMGYMLSEILQKSHGGQVLADEIGIPVASSGLILPAGATAIWTNFSKERDI